LVYYYKNWQHYNPKDFSGGIIVFNNKRKQALTIIGLFLLLCIIGYSLGYLYRFSVKEPEKDGKEGFEMQIHGVMEGQEPDGLIQESSGQADNLTARDTVLSFRQFFLKCQHLIEESKVISNSEVGMNQEQLASLYPDWTLKQFEKSRVVFEKQTDNYCPNHFIIFDENGYLAVYKTSFDDGELHLHELTDIRSDMLDEHFRNLIKQGKAVETLEEIDYIIENWDS